MLTRLLKIMNLLLRQQAITRAELAEACAVSEEAVDRLVVHLKAAGVPVRFDTNTGIYRLTDGATGDSKGMSPFDVFVMRLAVRLLKARLNGLYKPTVENIEAHLENLSSQALPVKIDHLLDSIERRTDPTHLLRDLNCCLILEAIRLGRQIQVYQSDHQGCTRTTRVSKASLEFGEEWVLRDLDGGDRQIPISTVTDIRLV